MNCLVIDNFDSFTFNLVQYLQELDAAVEVYRNDAITLDEVHAARPNAIVLSPGPCSPSEAGISLDVVKEFAGHIPILGVCLGHQAIGQALGGRVVRAGHVMHGKTSRIQHDGRGLFKDIEVPFEATRYHSLALEPDTLPDSLRVTAWCDDPNERTIMGIAHRTQPLWGVQFHPESILTPSGHAMLANFLTMAEAA